MCRSGQQHGGAVDADMATCGRQPLLEDGFGGVRVQRHQRPRRSRRDILDLARQVRNDVGEPLALVQVRDSGERSDLDYRIGAR